MKTNQYCECWFCINTGPNGECEKCGKPRSPLEKIVNQIKEWEWASFDRSQDQERKTEEQAYHLGKRDAYELVRVLLEQELCVKSP